MEDGIGSIKILVIVLVVVIQGVNAFRGWAKKQKLKREQEERGIRSGTAGIYTSDNAQPEEDATPEIPDWDPFEERPRAPELPPIHAETPPPPVVEPPAAPTPVYTPAPKPTLIRSAPVPETERAPLVASVAAVAIQSHRLSDPTRQLRANRTTARLVGDVSLRTAMLAKIVLDRPLSARALGGRLRRS